MNVEESMGYRIIEYNYRHRGLILLLLLRCHCGFFIVACCQSEWKNARGKKSEAFERREGKEDREDRE